MKNYFLKLIFFLPLCLLFFIFPGKVEASNFAALTVTVKSSETTLKNIRIDFTALHNRGKTSYTGGGIPRSCTNAAFVKLVIGPDIYVPSLSFYTDLNGTISWNGINNYGFACSCNDLRITINLPKGYIMKSVFGATTSFLGGTTAGGTATMDILANNTIPKDITIVIVPTPTITPTITPTVTPQPPKCNDSCTTPADCYTTKDGCTTCIENKCVKPPACGTACTTPADCYTTKDGCTTCIENKCTLPLDTCTCDGITYTDLFSGQDVTITSFSKVTGSDIKNARVVSEKFFLAKGTFTKGKIIAQSGNIPSEIIENTSNKVRYKTEWKLKLPQLETGSTYRLWSDINCQPKTITMATNIGLLQKKAVLGSETKKSFLSNVFEFFTNIFSLSGDSSKQETNFKSLTSTTSVPGKKTIQLETIRPITIIDKACSTIIFKQN